MKVYEPEFTELAKRLATAIKIERLRAMPGMDDVAVALNCQPTHEEHLEMKHVLRLIEHAGYEIHKAD